MIRAIHVEDELHNQALLKQLLARHCADKIMLVGSAKNKNDAVALIARERPQLLFLDVELQSGNSFELIDLINDYSLEIIFITAYAKYAVEAFRVNAVDYILKPISTKSLRECVDRAVLKINEKNAKTLPGKESSALDTTDQERRVGFHTHEGTVFLQVHEIISIEASGSYSIIQTVSGKKFTLTKNVKQVEEVFPEDSFVRVHHSWSVNMKHVQRYIPGKSGFVEMINGGRIPVSIRKKGIFLDKF